MADVKFEVVNFTASQANAGSTQDVTISGFGTPKAVMFIFNSYDALDTVTPHCKVGYGWTDGVFQCCEANLSWDATANVSAAHLRSNTYIIDILKTNDSTFRASFNSWIADGVRINLDVRAVNPYLVTAIFMGGADLQANAGEVSLGDGTSPIDVTTVGFKPKFVFVGMGAQAGEGYVASRWRPSFGIAYDNGTSIENRSTSLFQISGNSTTGAHRSGIWNDRCYVERWSSTEIPYYVAASDFDASGFTFNVTNVAGDPASKKLRWLAIDVGDADVSVFDTQYPTSGNYVETQAGFTPTFGFLTSTSYVTTRNDDPVGNQVLNVTAFHGDALSSSTHQSLQGVTTTDNNAYISGNLNIPNGDKSALELASSGYAFTSTGWDFTLTTNPTTNPILAWGLAIGPGGAAGVTFDGPDIVAQTGTENTAFSFDENGEGNVASRFTGATSYALSPSSDPLPTGLSVNPTTGNIEGTPTEVATRNIIIRGSQ